MNLHRTHREPHALTAMPDPQRTDEAILLRATKRLPGFPTEEAARRFLDEECRKSTKARLRELERAR